MLHRVRTEIRTQTTTTYPEYTARHNMPVTMAYFAVPYHYTCHVVLLLLVVICLLVLRGLLISLPRVPSTSRRLFARQEENHARTELERRKQEQRLRERNRRQREIAEERRLRELKKKVRTATLFFVCVQSGCTFAFQSCNRVRVKTECTSYGVYWLKRVANPSLCT